MRLRKWRVVSYVPMFDEDGRLIKVRDRPAPLYSWHFTRAGAEKDARKLNEGRVEGRHTFRYEAIFEPRSP